MFLLTVLLAQLTVYEYLTNILENKTNKEHLLIHTVHINRYLALTESQKLCSFQFCKLHTYVYNYNLVKGAVSLFFVCGYLLHITERSHKTFFGKLCRIRADLFSIESNIFHCHLISLIINIENPKLANTARIWTPRWHINFLCRPLLAIKSIIEELL